MRGESEPNGILEDELQLAPQRPHRRAVERRRGRGPRSGSCPSHGRRRRSARPSVDLPEPDSPTMPIVSPACSVERDAVDRLQLEARRRLKRPPRQAEGHADVAGLEQHAARRRRTGGLRPVRLGGEQHPRVGVRGAGEDVARPAPLSTTSPRAHHVDAVGEAADDAEVVGDEDDRHAEARLQLGEELEDLRLDGDVERGRRLVGDQDVGIVGERHGDHHALALAAGQLVRIGVDAPLGLGDAAPARRSSSARARAAVALEARHAAISGSAIWSPIR